MAVLCTIYWTDNAYLIHHPYKIIMSAQSNVPQDSISLKSTFIALVVSRVQLVMLFGPSPRLSILLPCVSWPSMNFDTTLRVGSEITNIALIIIKIHIFPLLSHSGLLNQSLWHVHLVFLEVFRATVLVQKVVLSRCIATECTFERLLFRMRKYVIL